MKLCYEDSTLTYLDSKVFIIRQEMAKANVSPMLNDLFILKNGLPIFTRNECLYDNSRPNEDQITMISGFLSAINSFAKNVDALGNMKEMKMEDVSFLFFKPPNDHNLLFVGASKGKDIEGTMVEAMLKKISSAFIRRFPFITENKWDGETEIFKDFETILENIIHHKDSLENPQEFSGGNISKFDASLVPYKRIKKIYERGIYDLFSSNDSKLVFQAIDGVKDLGTIADETDVPLTRVYSLCKSFIKMGLVLFKKQLD
ncbi:MAG: hypothetical protein JW776_15205 [Candidatus Lokiarchaeota archaeon]|nr:hypothetical protein [Candidatus Lokiarchaeota archaeon]